MGTYNIPRNVGGESRILYIFTVKSLITTGAGGMIGSIFYFIFLMVELEKVGIGIAIFFALVGYIIGAVKIPTIAGIPVTKKIGGEPLSEIIMRYAKFKKNRRMYLYHNKED